jgi:tetratricopeptide (TPR) repeat protein
VNLAQLRDQAHRALKMGDVPQARTHFNAIVHSNNATPQLLREIAGSLWALYAFADALRAYRRAAIDDPQNIESHLLAGQKLFSIARFRDCADFLEQARAIRPNDVDLLVMLGEVHDRGNRLTDAETCAHNALAINPHHVKAIRLMAHLERRRGQLDQARQRLGDHLLRFPSPEDWRLRYELAAVLDRLGEFDRAMAELLNAKAQLHPQSQPHVPVANAIRQRQRQVAALLTPADWATWLSITNTLQPHARLAFLCGHPRSGTTLLEQILGAHPDVVTTDETGILTREFIEPIIRQPASATAAIDELRSFDATQLSDGRSAYLEFTREHLTANLGDHLLIEKDPSLTPDLPLPLRLFPEARVLFPLRDPRDICISYFFTLIPLNHVSVAATDLKSTCEFCAHTLASWQHFRQTIPHPSAEPRYENLVAHPESEMRRLLGFLDLPWNDQLLKFHERSSTQGVRTPTYADVTQPLYQRSVGRWRNYEKYLAPHLSILDPWLRTFGYA